jgi:NADP-dependent 3-hydroxy acid dehydrogenase YdfG
MDDVTSNQYRQQYENKLLHDKVAVIFGAGGAIGSQIAREFHKEGATIFLSGRHLQMGENVVKKIQASKERVYAAEVDALNERAVKVYLDDVTKQAGRLDIVINAIGLQPDECGD